MNLYLKNLSNNNQKKKLEQKRLEQERLEQERLEQERMEIFIILSKYSDKHDYVNALGHEIHISRYILYDLLQKNIINNDVNIVTISQDRFFLYDNIFTKIYKWSDYENIAKNNNIKKIDLSFYSYVSTQNIIIDELKELNYTFDSFEKTNKFIDYINNINIINLNEEEKYKLIIENDFFIIHIRFKNDNSKLLKILNKIREYTNNTIIIFCSSNIILEYENIIIINNLQYYASFLSNKNCKLLITEWSGGGQLSQYCFNSKIIYYFDNYESHNYELNYIEYQKTANISNNIFNSWDFKSTTLCDREYYKSFELMINDLAKKFNYLLYIFKYI